MRGAASQAFRWVLLATALGGSAADGQTPAPAKGEAPLSFRVDSSLVVVDLLASDRAGRFVDDLRAEEIRVSEDGERRPLEYLQLVRVGRASPVAGPVEPPVLPLSHATAEARAAPASGALAVVIDLQSTPPETLPRVLDAVRSMVLTEVPDGTALLLASVWHGLSIRQPLTTDRALFLAALEKIGHAPVAGSSLQRLAEEIDHTDLGLREATNVARAVIAETARELADVSQSLSALSRLLSPVSGRKHVVLYSMGHAIRPAQGAISLLQDRFPVEARRSASELAGLELGDGVGEVQRLVDDANRAQVSFYTVDPMGLQVGLPDATSRVSVRDTVGPTGVTRRAALREPQEYLRVLAGDTGGRAFVNTNDLAAGLRSAAADAGEYYLVAFAPSESSRASRPGFHRIRLEVARRGLDLRYRRGYWRDTQPQRSERDAILASRFPDLYADGALRVETRLADGALGVTSFLAPASLQFVAREGRHHATISLQAFLRDASGKLVGGKGLFAMDVALRLSDAELSALRASDNVEMPASAPAPARGTYTLLVLARHGTHLSAATLELVVP